MLPEMTPVQSSNVDSVGWDAATSRLYIKFNSGSIYVYENVPEDVFLDLEAAVSVGSYFNRQVKGQYVGKLYDNTEGTTPTSVATASPAPPKKVIDYNEEMAELGLDPNDFIFRE